MVGTYIIYVLEKTRLARNLKILPKQRNAPGYVCGSERVILANTEDGFHRDE
jgi:hypothetical protein